MANKFRVLKGVHIQDGREYKEGEIVTSERSLSSLFAGKFAPVGPAPAPVPSALSVAPHTTAVEAGSTPPLAIPPPPAVKPAAASKRRRGVKWDE